MQIDAVRTDLAQSSSYANVKEAASQAKFSEFLQKADQQAKASQAVGNSTATAQQDKKLREACEGFEAMFMNLMYSKMRDTVPEDTLFGNSNSDKIMQSMMDTEMMNRAAKSGGMGLADMLYKQLSREATAVHTLGAVKK